MRLALACAFVATIVTYLALTIPAHQREERTMQLARRAACLEWRRLPYTGHITTDAPPVGGRLAFGNP